MHKFILVAAMITLAGCNQQEAAAPANDANLAADANVAADANAVNANAAGTALASINETTWEFTEDGKPMQESVDAAGPSSHSGKEHIAMARGYEEATLLQPAQ